MSGHELTRQELISKVRQKITNLIPKLQAQRKI